MELDIESPIFNYHFDFDYNTEPGLYPHVDNNCEGHIVTKSGYFLFCERCGQVQEWDEWQ